MRRGEKKCTWHRFSSNRSVRDYYPPHYFLYERSVIFFYYRSMVPREREREREQEKGRNKDKSSDKRVRFIASLILFIDTRIALRLRSQRLRRRNSVAKLGRVKTRPKRCLFVQFYRIFARTFLSRLSIIPMYHKALSFDILSLKWYCCN